MEYLNPSDLLSRIDDIKNLVSNTNGTLALLGLGSIGADLIRLDNYSDLDFFVIVKDKKAKETLLLDLYWLESPKKFSFKFKNTKDGYKALYEDGIFIEMAIFVIDELKYIPYSKGRIIWIDKSFEPTSIPLENNLPKFTNSIEWLLGELLTNLYIGMSRYCRGEKLSAYKFIHHYAIDRFIELMMLKLNKNKDILLDNFSIDRRIELNYPEIVPYLKELLNSYMEIPKSCSKILTIIMKYYSINQNIEVEINKLLNSIEK